MKTEEMTGNGKRASEEVASVPEVVASRNEEIIIDESCPDDVFVTVVDVED